MAPVARPARTGGDVVPASLERARAQGPAGMSDAREAILERIRVATADGPSVGSIPRTYRVATRPGIDVVERFVERVADYRATVARTTLDGIGLAVADALAQHHATRVVVPHGVPRPWLADAAVETLADDPPLSHAALDAVDAVVTGCAIAIAETGTIVLDAGPDQGRRVLSLLPDVHVCVVRAEQIVGDVPEALARLDARRPLTWISGPSATSDIELSRVEGVHGPRNLVVVVVDETRV